MNDHPAPRARAQLLDRAERRGVVEVVRHLLVHPGGGVIRAVVLVDGRAAGTWRARRTARRIEVTVEPFESLAESVLPGLTVEADDVARFLGRDEARFGIG